MAPLLALLLQTAAAAPPPLPLPPVPRGALTARVEAELVLTRAGAADVFADETAADASGLGAIRLRHRPSGFLCRLDPGGGAQVQVYGSLRRGDDVRCTSRGRDGERSLFIYRTPERSLAELATQAEREMRNETHDDAAAPAPAESRTVAATATTPEHEVDVLRSGQGVDRFVVGKVGEWAVQARHLAPLLATAEPSDTLEAWWAARLGDRAAPQPLAAAAAPPAAVDPAAKRAEAQRLLAQGGAGPWFEAVDEPGAVIALRHKASGWTCLFSAGGRDNSVAVLPHQPQGSDLRCQSREVDGLVSTFLSRIEPAPSLQVAFAGFVQEIRAAHPDAKPFVGQVANIQQGAKPGAPVLPPTLTARFTYQREGQTVFSRLQVAVVDGWIIEQRLDGPPDKALAMDLLGGLLFTGGLGRRAASGAPVAVSGGAGG